MIRNVEIIGEATKRLNDELKSAHAEVPWKQIAGVRDKLIHQYFGVKLELVWEVVQTHLPALLATVAALIQASAPPIDSAPKT